MSKQPLILVACEESQTICKAFRENGFIAYSNDLQKCSGGHPEWHIYEDALKVVAGNNAFKLENGELTQTIEKWDLVIGHPPCTYLAKSSAVAKSKGYQTEQQMRDAETFFWKMYNANAKHVCIENPVPLKKAIRIPYTQIIQPYDFGHNWSKMTCLWLRDLPPLLPTHAKYLHPKSWHYGGSSSSKRRSKSFSGIANAMVQQWGNLL